LSKFNQLIEKVEKDIENHNFSLAGEALRDFTWDTLADWYLEASKFEKNKGPILIYILRTLLKLWHPFIPFVTETIWGKFNDSMLMVEKWPEVEIKVKGGGDFELVKDIITAIRNVRSENEVEPGRKIKAVIYAGNKLKLIKSNEALIKSMKTGIGELLVENKGRKHENEIYTTVDNIEIYLIGAIDKDKERKRLEKEIENLDKFTKSVGGKLNNKEFIKNAPKEIINSEKEKLEMAKDGLDRLKEQLKRL